MSILTPLSEKAKGMLNKFEEALAEQRRQTGSRHQMTRHKQLASVANQYGICIASDVWCRHRQFTFEGATEAEQGYAAQLLAEELQLYTAETFRRMRLDTIIICARLTQNGTAASGMSCMGTKLGNAVLLNMALLYKCSRMWGATAIHHELFHAIDYGDDLWSYEDPEWEKLNAVGFCYSGYSPELSHEGKTDDEGFVTGYAKAAVCEDKAELYTYLINDYQWVMKRAADDRILFQKVKRLKSILKKFSSQFDEVFWMQVRERCAKERNIPSL